MDDILTQKLNQEGTSLTLQAAREIQRLRNIVNGLILAKNNLSKHLAEFDQQNLKNYEGTPI